MTQPNDPAPEPSQVDKLREAGQFLIDRIDQLEWMDDGYEDLVRDWMGHVDPALSRFRTALSNLATPSAAALENRHAR